MPENMSLLLLSGETGCSKALSKALSAFGLPSRATKTFLLAIVSECTASNNSQVLSKYWVYEDRGT
ncbi:hypothetical protein P5673_015948 [Acropora cervicornis]|uniref:Uncharacterized protein n=1 Tax=Acropora cervicornis TaxID=6130 RepID=A0AAD9V5F7_ACRCE|nr:hypothetical protein P5673_015948 [Acropora cervicornis]